MAVRVAVLHGVAWPNGVLPLLLWHTHEMPAGFLGAAICGFLLTAIPNWTGRRGYAGPPPMLVVALFVLARAVLWPAVPVPPQVAATIALLPLPALLLLVLPALIRTRPPRPFGPPALVLVFWAGDLLTLGDIAGWWTGWFDTGRMLALNVALALVGLIGGRIVPSFTLNALPSAGRPAELRPMPGVDRGAILALLLVVLGDLAAPGTAASGVIAGAAAVLVLLAALLRGFGSLTVAPAVAHALSGLA